MKIFELTPANLESRNWKASRYRGIVIVRAATERAARIKANGCFAVAAASPPLGETLAIAPWNSSDVACRVIEDSDYPTDGPAGVLDPIGYED